MGLSRNRRAYGRFLFFLLLPGTRHCFAALFEGIEKMALALAVASLLVLLVVHAPEICQWLIACRWKVRSYRFRMAAAVAWARPTDPVPAVSRKPPLPFRFQLPPPVFLL